MYTLSMNETNVGGTYEQSHQKVKTWKQSFDDRGRTMYTPNIIVYSCPAYKMGPMSCHVQNTYSNISYTDMYSEPITYLLLSTVTRNKS